MTWPKQYLAGSYCFFWRRLWGAIFFRYLNLDDVIRLTRCPAAGSISLVARGHRPYLPSHFPSISFITDFS
jgi:hypothetical protein